MVRHTAAMVVVLALTPLASACGAHREVAAGTPAVTVTSPPPPCPASYDSDHLVPPASGARPLVPSGAGGAVLCVYAAAGRPVLPLAESRPLVADPGDLVDSLNALPGSLPVGVVNACLAMDRPQYRIIFTYVDRQPVTVTIDANCATADQGETARYLMSLRTIRASWER